MTGNVHSRKRFMKEPQIKDYKDIDDWSADYSYYESCKKIKLSSLIKIKNLLTNAGWWYASVVSG